MTCVLIVDDEPEQARSLSRVFAKLRPDLTILTARNGRDATRLMQARSVDLVLTDLQMPEMDGFELMSWVREHSPETAVFIMSAYGTGRTAEQLDALGASDFFAKPVDEHAVITRLADAVNQLVRGQVHNLSLASFLQLLEMERKSCTLHVVCKEQRGLLVVSKGVLVSATNGDLQGEAAAISIVAWPSPTIDISRPSEPTGTPIKSSLGFIVMEAMRLQDEAALLGVNGDGGASVWPTTRRSWRPIAAEGVTFESSRPEQGELGLPNGARALALVETATGNVLRASAREDCPVGELARLAAQLLLQEAETLRLCNEEEGVEELVLSTSTRCDVIRPMGNGEFALLIFAPEETNLVIARLELDHFIVSHRAARASGR
ncbi:MAG TPA: response regulator [Polyangiaceae bacterium]|nr:response regulator [Polyangiaceae bacterium]